MTLGMTPSLFYHLSCINCEDWGGNGHLDTHFIVLVLVLYVPSSHTAYRDDATETAAGIAVHALFQEEQNEHFQ